MKNLVIVTDSEGLVGSRFVELSKHQKSLHTPRVVEFDITNKVEVEAIMKSFDFLTVVNFASFTDVNKAEEERGNKNGQAWLVNAEGPKNLSEVLAGSKKKIHLIHISTDMVFSGDVSDKGPYGEGHPIETDLDKLTWYGYTKGQGELAVKNALGENSTIIRIIYPVRAKFESKMDYLRKPLSLFDQSKLYPIFSDQQVSISFIDEVVSALDKIIEEKIYGTFHVGSRDTATPFELASYMLEKVRGVNDVVTPIKVDDFLKSAKVPSFRYPKFGGLSITETEKILEMKFSSWKEIIDKLIFQGLGKK